MVALSLQHQARELLHVIGMASSLLNTATVDSRRWRAEIFGAKGRLKGLCAKGLDRRELLATIRADARTHRTMVPGSSVNALRGRLPVDRCRPTAAVGSP